MRLYGTEWKDDASPLAIEFKCIRKGGRWIDQDGYVCGLGMVDHYKNAMRLMWPEDDEHRWESLIHTRLAEKDIVTIMGASDCVSGDTRILDPITGENPTIESLCSDGRRPHVMTLSGPELASVPYFKGMDWLYEVTCENGNKFTATSRHRVLTMEGFVYVEDLRIGQGLLAYDEDHPLSNEVFYQEAQRQGVCCLRNRSRDSRGDYRHGPCSYGAQLLTAEGGGLEPFPLQACVPKHIPGSFDQDGLENESERSCFESPIFLQSNARSMLLDGSSGISSSLHSLRGTPSPLSLSSRQPFQLLSDYSLHGPSSLRGRNFESTLSEIWISLRNTVHPTVVISIRKVRFDSFFDLTVPKAGNYFAEGFIHHNSSKTYSVAKYVLCDWWVDPLKRLWLVSSTDKRGAELRVWGKLKEFFNRARQKFPWLPGKVLESKSCITPSEISDDGGEGRLLTQGIIFVPTRTGSTYTGLTPWIGIKPPPGGKLGHAGDECFPTGTMVDTPSGRIPIETVHSGDWIIGAAGPALVKACSVRTAKNLVRVQLDDGTSFDCTPDHPVLTRTGWVKAHCLSFQSELVSRYASLRILPEGTTGENLSDAFLLRCLSEGKLEEELRELRKEFHPFRTESDNMQQIVCCNMEMESAGDCKKVQRESSRSLRIREDDESSDHGQSKRESKTIQVPNGKWIMDSSEAQTWMPIQWNVCDAKKRIDHAGPFPEREEELQDSDRKKFEVGSQSSSLPFGSCMAGTETGCGDRRFLSQNAKAENQGPGARRIHDWPRVVSVEVLKPDGDPRYNAGEGGYRVHNLEIEGHPSYSVNGLIVHNCQLMQHSFLDAYANWYGKENFQGILTGNPADLEDPLCTAAEPVDGWDNWKDTGKTQEWESKFYGAHVICLDGRDTPNNDFPYVGGKPKFPYLIGKKKLDRVKELYGDNDWHWWHQCVGKPQTSVQARRVITRAHVDHNNAYDEPVWQDGNRTKICALDAAYGGVGGDRCVIMPGEFGKEVGGKTILAPGKWELVPVSVANNPEAADIQIAKFCKAFCESKGIPPTNFFFDGRGTLAVAMARIWSPEVNVVDFGGAPSDRVVSNDEFIWDGDNAKRLKLCSEHYFNFVTELWFSLHYLIISGQLKNLDREVAREAFKRTWDRTRSNKIQVEPKSDMKERTLQSPDLADTMVTLLEGARRLGLEIGSARSINLVIADDYLAKELAKYDKMRKASSLKYDTAH